MIPEHIYKTAYNLLGKSNYYPYHVACVVFKSKRIMGVGYNQIRTAKRLPSRYIRFKNALHAEAHAVMSIGLKNMKRCSVLVIRQNVPTKIINMARPCEYCYALLADCNVKDMYYTGPQGVINYERIN